MPEKAGTESKRSGPTVGESSTRITQEAATVTQQQQQQHGGVQEEAQHHQQSSEAPPQLATVSATTTASPTATMNRSIPVAATPEDSSPTKPPPTKKQAVEQQQRAPVSSASTRDAGSKTYKGLRHFSMMVCKKVEEKGTTTYNEVADELVKHVITERLKEDPGGKFDEKNIRRRVYDALNVLMAMEIIQKDKKSITWKGLPTTAHQDLDMLTRERSFREQEVERKREALRELLTQQVCFRNLVRHNKQREQSKQQQESTDPADNKIPIPFIVVNTNSSAVIQCNMSRDLTDVMFDFSMPFEINDDNTILKKLGMHKTDMSVLREMLPEEMLQYCEKHSLLDGVLGDSSNKKDSESTPYAEPQFTSFPTTTSAPASPPQPHRPTQPPPHYYPPYPPHPPPVTSGTPPRAPKPRGPPPPQHPPPPYPSYPNYPPQPPPPPYPYHYGPPPPTHHGPPPPYHPYYPPPPHY